MEQHLISIIIPLYNAADTVKRCIDSIIIQSGCNYEILIIDNGSTDNSISICEDLSAQYSQIKILTCLTKGAHSARLEGFRQAKGKYLMFVDADDELLPNSIRTLYDAILHGYDFVKGHEEKFDSRRKVSSVEMLEFSSGEICSREQYEELMYINHISPYLHGCIYKKELFTEDVFKQCIDNNVTIGEDWISNLLISNKVNHGLVINDVVYRYYVGHNSTMRSSVLGWNNGAKCEQALLPFVNRCSEKLQDLIVLKSMEGNVRNQFVPELPFRVDIYEQVKNYMRDSENKKKICQLVPRKFLAFYNCLPIFYLYSRLYAHIFKWYKLGGKLRKVV